MKHKLLVLSAAIFLMCLTAGCGESQAQEEKNTTAKENTQEDTGTLITEEKAKSIALEDAGVEEKDTKMHQIKLRTEDGIQVYKVEFYHENKEYDYEIDAVKGTVLSKDAEIEEAAPQTQNEPTVSMEDAKSLVLQKVEGATEENMQIHLDTEDGRTVYEGSVLHEGKEYEFKVDGETSEFLEWEEETANR